MFLGIQGEVVFSGKDAERILALMASQGRASRSAYQAIQKGLEGKELRDHLKTQGHDAIGVRYLESAINAIENLKEKRHVLFGGKKNWQKLLDGEISKPEWHRLRNRSLSTRGDRSKKGNPLHRLQNGTFKVLIPVAKGQRGIWITSERLRLFGELPPEALSCYNTRLLHLKGRKFELQISWSFESKLLPVQPGMIGVDTNPNLLAGIETDASGNPIGKISIALPRVMDAKAPKRENDIFLAAKEIVDFALAKGKALAIEDLNFGSRNKRPKGKRRNRRFNRMRCGWAYRKLLEAIERRALKNGVPLHKVKPAYTSVLGLAKFTQMYNLSRHHAAALVIARRAQGFAQERQNFSVSFKPDKKQKKETQADKPRDLATTERKPIRVSQKKPVPAKKTRTVRLTEVSFFRLSKYLRGTGIPRAEKLVENPKMVGVHTPSSRTGLNTRPKRRNGAVAVRHAPSTASPLGGGQPVNQQVKI